MMGILSEVGGVTSETIPKKTVTERRFVISIRGQVDCLCQTNGELSSPRIPAAW